MYLARFSTVDEEWIQVAVRIDSTPSRGAAQVTAFWDEVACHFAAMARISRSTVARRITVGRERRLREVAVVTAPAEEEASITQAIAALMRLEMAGGSLATTQVPAEHDQWLAPEGQFRLCPTAAEYTVHGVPLACDFRIAPMLDELIEGACAGGYGFTYQLHVRTVSVGADVLRAVRKNVLRLEEIPGARRRLIEWQDRLAREMDHAIAICEEFVVVDSPAACDTVSSLLVDQFRMQYGPLGFAAPVMTFDVGRYEENLRVAVHSHDMYPLSPVELCGAALGLPGRGQLLEWRPSSRVVDTGDSAGVLPDANRRRKVLFLGATHKCAPLDLGREVSRIQQNLDRSRAGARLKLTQVWAATIDSLMQALLEQSPEIVHFSGHGRQDGIILLDEAGEEQAVPGEELAKLFRLFSGTVRCVVLNSCFSEHQVHAIRRYIPHVVGIRGKLDDESAIAFSTGFYKAVAAERDIPFAFELGKARVSMPGLEGEDLLILL